jgi:hypothetical protein
MVLCCALRLMLIWTESAKLHSRKALMSINKDNYFHASLQMWYGMAGIVSFMMIKLRNAGKVK